MNSRFLTFTVTLSAFIISSNALADHHQPICGSVTSHATCYKVDHKRKSTAPPIAHPRSKHDVLTAKLLTKESSTSVKSSQYPVVSQ